MHTMNLKTLHTKVTKPTLLPMEMGSTKKFNMSLTPELHKKIEFLCREIPTREWSGVLFYTVEGSINDIENVKVDAYDVYPMDIGSASYTEFDYDATLAHYIAMGNHPEDMQMGLIHSHQSLGVFFSGTDTDTLREQAPLYKNFLSLIVNNRGEMVAAMSVHVQEKKYTHTELKYNNFKGEATHDIHEVKEEEYTEKVYRYDANIIENVTLESDFLGIVHRLKEKNKPKPPTPKHSTYPTGNYTDTVIVDLDYVRGGNDPLNTERSAVIAEDPQLSFLESLDIETEISLDTIMKILLKITSGNPSFPYRAQSDFNTVFKNTVNYVTNAFTADVYEMQMMDTISYMLHIEGILSDVDKIYVLEEMTVILDNCGASESKGYDGILYKSIIDAIEYYESL